MKAWLVFMDESAFSQRPPIRATWAPRGRTPRLVEPFNWEKLSGIGAVLTSPDGRRLRWLLALHQGSVRSAQVGARETLVPKIWLQVKSVDAPLEAKLKEIALQIDGSELKTCP